MATLALTPLRLDQKAYCLSLNRGPLASQSEAWPHTGSFDERHPYNKRVCCLQAGGKTSASKILITTSKRSPRAACQELCLTCMVAAGPTIWGRQMLSHFLMRNREVEDSANVLPLVVMGTWWKTESKTHSYFRSGRLTALISLSLSFPKRKLVPNAKKTKGISKLGQTAKVDPCSDWRSWWIM